MQNEFFILDSNNIKDTNSKLYGYMICSNGIITQDNIELLDIYNKSEEGAFILIESNEKEIQITQDYYGSWGLYYYENEEYFAISNSFILLIEHIYNDYHLSLDMPYLDSFVYVSLSSYSVYDTPIKEIKLLDRWAIIKYDKEQKKLCRIIKNHNESTIPINSIEGIQILDNWYYKWTTIIKNLIYENVNISADLSGGLDTRMMFTLFLSPQIELNNVQIHSIDADYHCFKDDYYIANEIGKKYNFNLNEKKFNEDGVTYSVNSIDTYYKLIKLGFHKIPYLPKKCLASIKYSFTGEGGECIRGYWKNKQCKNFMIEQLSKYRELNIVSKSELYPNVIKFIKKQYKILKDKYSSLNHTISENDLTNILYRESRARHHFGKAHVERYLSNQISLSPLMDPLINKLYSDVNELPAIIFQRYCPDLIKIKIEGNRIIEKNHIENAQKINSMYPYFGEKIKNNKYTLPNSVFSYNEQKTNTKYDNFEKYITELISTNKSHNEYCKYFCKETYDFLIKNLYIPGLNFSIDHATSIYTLTTISKYIKDDETTHINEESINVYNLFNLFCNEKYWNIINYKNKEKNNLNVFEKILVATAYSKIDAKTYSGVIYDYLINAYRYGIIESLYQLYDILYMQSDSYSSIQLYLVCDKLLSIDSIDAYIRLARSYRYGKGMKKDFEQSFKYYEKAFKICPKWILNEYINALFEEHSKDSLQKINELNPEFPAV